MGDIYKPTELKEDAIQKKLIVDAAVDVQTILQILIKNDITTKEEVDTFREKVRSIPKYKAAYEMIDSIGSAAELYEKDPQAYLKALFNAKLNGNT